MYKSVPSTIQEVSLLLASPERSDCGGWWWFSSRDWIAHNPDPQETHESMMDATPSLLLCFVALEDELVETTSAAHPTVVKRVIPIVWRMFWFSVGDEESSGGSVVVSWGSLSRDTVFFDNCCCCKDLDCCHSIICQASCAQATLLMDNASVDTLHIQESPWRSRLGSIGRCASSWLCCIMIFRRVCPQPEKRGLQDQQNVHCLCQLYHE